MLFLSSGSAAIGGFLLLGVVAGLHFSKLYAFKILLKYCAKKERLIVPLSINSIVLPKNSSVVDLVNRVVCFNSKCCWNCCRKCCVATLSPMTSDVRRPTTVKCLCHLPQGIGSIVVILLWRLYDDFLVNWGIEESTGHVGCENCELLDDGDCE
eukprot:4115588-Amphidinium_carterae.3